MSSKPVFLSVMFATGMAFSIGSAAQSLMLSPAGSKSAVPVAPPTNVHVVANPAGPVCAGGRTGGAYEMACSQVNKYFADNQTGVALQVRSFGGSQANLDELTTESSPVAIAAVQVNDLLSKQAQIGKDELSKKAMRLGVVGKECGYMLALTGGKVDDLEDLSDQRGTLYVVGKGANSIWRALSQTYPSYFEKITVVTEQPGAAGKPLETADAVALVLDAGKTARAMFIVQLNNFSFSPDAKQMIEQLEAGKLSLVALDWRKFDDEISGLGQPFTIEKGLLLRKGMFSRDVAVQTVCTESLVVYNPGKVAANPVLSAAMSKLKTAPGVVKVETTK